MNKSNFLKFILVVFVLLSFFSQILFADPQAEIYFLNRIPGQDLYVRFYPVSALFNGAGDENPPTFHSLRALGVNPGNPTDGYSRKNSIGPPLKYIIGLDSFALHHFRYNNSDSLYFKVQPSTENDYSHWMLLGHDASDNSGMDGLFGYGKYNFEIYTSGSYTYDLVCKIPIDWMDFSYPYSKESGGSKDLKLRIYSLDPLDITFQWLNNNFDEGGNGDEIHLFGSGSPPYTGQIEVYNQYYHFESNAWQGFFTTASKGNSLTDTSYLVYPLDGRRLPSDYAIPQHKNPGMFFGNIIIDNNISTQTALLENPTDIIMTNQTSMVIDSGKIFTMVAATSPSNGSTNLIIDTLSHLSLLSGAKIIVYPHNRITLRKNSSLRQFPNSEIRIISGAYFCNEGASIRGGNIIYEKGTHQPMCSQLSDFLIKDSAKIILADSAVVEIPDSTTIRLIGNTTSLILGYNSKLKFGVGSKILIDSGAKLIANNSIFCSTDSTKKWVGITIKGLSQDTIKNCTVKNAYYGINISGKYDSDTTKVYSTEISGCDFVNETSSALNNAVYVYNSNNILIKDNTVSSTISAGYTFGVYAEYCPAGNFNIIGNEINNSTGALAIIQSSPYIARNTITGNAYTENGMFLDNSNGTIEYNTVDDFFYSYYTFYSSPNLLSNTFSNSYEDVMYLVSYSTPVMHPIVAGSVTNYFAGENLITGSPTNSGINFTDESFPDINNGFNSFELTGTDYYINGEVPTVFDRDLYVLKNYWGETPQSGRFNVTDGTVHYSTYETGRTTFTGNYQSLYNIGFGLYDSVLVLDESENPDLTNETYLEAYQKEYSKDYEGAIELYKEIVAGSADSTYAASSLSRIFNCCEKKHADYSEFNSLESYYRNILNDTACNELLKNIAQDFMIKSKVKNSKMQEAINAYDSIYTANTNTSKGLHALLNKEILTSISLEGSTDNLGINSEFENFKSRQERVIQIISSLKHTKENIISGTAAPVNYTLSQNYPNPFNPSTIISFDIPKAGFVNIKVYDITGKEVNILVNEFKQSGHYNVSFDGRNLSSGIYFYRIETGSFIQTKKMLLIK